MNFISPQDVKGPTGALSILNKDYLATASLCTISAGKNALHDYSLNGYTRYKIPRKVLPTKNGGKPIYLAASCALLSASDSEANPSILAATRGERPFLKAMMTFSISLIWVGY